MNKQEIIFRVDQSNKQQQEEAKEERRDENRDLIANLLQIAVINKMLPKGYKFELFDTIKRQNDSSLASRGYVPKRKKVSKVKASYFKMKFHFFKEDRLLATIFTILGLERGI